MHFTVGFRLALVAMLLLSSSARSNDEVLNQIFITNHLEAGGALSCGDVQLVRQLRRATVQFYSLHPDVLDLALIEDGFNRRIELIRFIRGDRRGSEYCDKYGIPSARRALANTRALARKSASPSRNNAGQLDTVSSLKAMELECANEAYDLGVRVYSIKRRNNELTDIVTVQFERDGAVWPAKSVTAIYTNSDSSEHAGLTARVNCDQELLERLQRLRKRLLEN